MAEKNPFSAVGAAQKLQRRQGEVKAAIEKQTGSKSKKKTKRVTRKKGATTYARPCAVWACAVWVLRLSALAI